MKEPVDHILRPHLPWRSAAALTECGYDASKVKVISRDEHKRRLKDLGRQRTAMITCMTCADTAQRWERWEDDPRKAIGREIEWETRWSRDDRGEQLRDELLAIADLIEAHRPEFEAHLEKLRGQREWQKKKAMVATPKRPEKPLGIL